MVGIVAFQQVGKRLDKQQPELTRLLYAPGIKL